MLGQWWVVIVALLMLVVDSGGGVCRPGHMAAHCVKKITHNAIVS